MSESYFIENLWQCSVCSHRTNRGLKDRYCCNCGHEKDGSDLEFQPDDMSEDAALGGAEALLAAAGPDWICKYCQSHQNQRNKRCGNCGGDPEGTQLVSPAQAKQIGREVREDFESAQRETEKMSRRLDAVHGLRTDQEPTHAWVPYLVVGAVLAAIGYFIWWLFVPHDVQARCTRLSWQHDTTVERYAVQLREGWSAEGGSFEVRPLGLRHHHYDRVHVGSHQDPYQDRYQCGETCSTSPRYTTCDRQGNGTSKCTKHGGERSCSPKYCYRTKYRTVQDYKDVSRSQMWYAWKIWDWSYHRTVTKSGSGREVRWPTDAELLASLATGERERSSRSAKYSVEFIEVDDDETHKLAPATLTDYQKYDTNKIYKLRVTNAGSVEVLP